MRVSTLDTVRHRIVDYLDIRFPKGSDILWISVPNTRFVDFVVISEDLVLVCFVEVRRSDEPVTVEQTEFADWCDWAGCAHEIVDTFEAFLSVMDRHGFHGVDGYKSYCSVCGQSRLKKHFSWIRPVHARKDFPRTVPICRWCKGWTTRRLNNERDESART